MRHRRWEMCGWVLGIALVLIGLGAAVFPSFSFGRARTDGTVIKLEPEVKAVAHPDPYGGPVPQRVETYAVFYPVVEYRVGGKYLYRSRSVMESYRVGRKVPVLYRVDRPEVARLDTFSDRWVVPLGLASVLVAIGVFLTVVTAFFRSMRRTIEGALAQEEERHSVDGRKGSG